MPPYYIYATLAQKFLFQTLVITDDENTSTNIKIL